MNRTIRFGIALLECLVIAGGQTAAQSFAVTPGDTVKSASLGSEVIFEVGIKNTGGGLLTLGFVRTSNALPAGWQSALCLGSLCYASSLDSVALTQEFGSSPLRLGDSLLFSVHVTAQLTAGTGTVNILIKNLENPVDRKSIAFVTNATPDDVATGDGQPQECKLLQNYPNPFNPTTRIGYSVGAVSLPAGQAGGQQTAVSRVRLVVYDLLGREVAVLMDEQKQPGEYTATWDADGMASGVYFYRLSDGNRVETRRMTLLR